ncbi:MAG: hypothetical protein WC471_03900 [Candidatus Woesearchaeota archaeon]
MSLRKTIMSLLAGATLTATSMITGCGEETFKTKFKDLIQNNYGVTGDQADVAYVPAERDRYLVKNEDGTYSPSYKTVDLEKQKGRMDLMKKDLEQILSTFPPHMWSKYIDEQSDSNMRGLLSREEKVIDLQLRQLKAKKCYVEFQQMMGYAASGSKQIVETDRYAFADQFPDPDFGEKFKLGRIDVDKAKAKQEIERMEYFRKLLRDVPNPEFPFKDKIKQTIKREFKEGLVVIGYDINQPVDNVTDYYEIFRKAPDGRLESLPAIRIYKSLRSKTPNIAVVDEDRQGQRGFGMPDEVVRIMGVSDCDDIFYNNGKLINMAFKNPFDVRKMRLVDADRDIEIVATGKLENKLWVPSKEGYDVELVYKNDEDNNYTLSANKGVDLKDKKFEDWIFTRNYSDNSVSEMYKLKEAYRGLKIWDVRVRPTTLELEKGKPKKSLEIELVLEDFSSRTGTQEQFLEKVPMAITYNNGTKYTDTLLDADGKDNPRYELRLRQVQPLNPSDVSKNKP